MLRQRYHQALFPSSIRFFFNSAGFFLSSFFFSRQFLLPKLILPSLLAVLNQTRFLFYYLLYNPTHLVLFSFSDSNCCRLAPNIPTPQFRIQFLPFIIFRLHYSSLHSCFGCWFFLESNYPSGCYRLSRGYRRMEVALFLILLLSSALSIVNPAQLSVQNKNISSFK